MTEPYRDPSAEVWILDNRDSFVFNLSHRFAEIGVDSYVVRSDQVSVGEIAERTPRAIVISPGPGHPDAAGVSVEVVQKLGGQVAILGVCLGHQAVAVAYGGLAVRNEKPVHGKPSLVAHSGHPLFVGVPATFSAGRYHSLTVKTADSDLETIATLHEGDEIMGLTKPGTQVYGVQFHPESILTEYGTQILKNFLELAGF